MAEQTFKSPGFFEREIEIIKRPIVKNDATPAGLIGPARKGPAFVPTTVYSREEFIRIFGAPTRKTLSGHAAAEFFRNDGKALTFCRMLGAGHFDGTDIQNAGFSLDHTWKTPNAGVPTPANGLRGGVNFIVAQHELDSEEHIALGMYNDNDSHDTHMRVTQPAPALEQKVELVRAMILCEKDHSIKLSDTTDDVKKSQVTAAGGLFDLHIVNEATATEFDKFQISLDPDSSNYISKVLNTDPLSLSEKKVYLMAHFPVDTAVADVKGNPVAAVHGNFTAGKDYASEYGNFKSPYTAPETPLFISQPFGKKEYDLFYFESLDDGQYASDKYKISISNLRASDDPTDKFGTFTVTLRDLKDSDEAPIVYESYTNCSLNPDAANYIGRLIGDEKLYYNYTTTNLDERRLVREGTFKNVSSRIRVIVSDDVVNREIPEETLPFGFRGVPALLLNSDGKDHVSAGNSTKFIAGDANLGDVLKGSVMPPLPYRFKITKGTMQTGTAWAQTFTGEASEIESVDLNLYWGLMTERVENIYNPNSSNKFNHLVSNYVKFLSNSSSVWSKEKADSHNNNKFSLSKVSLGVASLSGVSGTINDVFKNAAYIRNADASNETLYDAASHKISLASTHDPLGSEMTSVSLAKLLAESPLDFNKYNLVAKFTAPFYGGFDGLNIFDSDSYYMTDRALTVDSTIGGKAGAAGFTSALAGTTGAAMQGANLENN